MNAQVMALSRKSIRAQLTLSQRLYTHVTPFFLSVLMATLMLHIEFFLFVAPVLFLPYIAWRAASRAEEWHGSQYPQGYVKGDATALMKTYRNAAISGLIFSGLAVWFVTSATAFGVWLLLFVGSCALGPFFFVKGLLRGWERVATPLGNEAQLTMPKKVQNVVLWNGAFIAFTISMLISYAQYKQTVDAVDAAAEAQQQSQVQEDATAQVMGQSADTQTQEQAPQAQPQVQAAAPAAVVQAAQAPAQIAPTVIPPDDASQITAMSALAVKAATAAPADVEDSQYTDINVPVPLWANAPRADGYPAYAAACDITKDVCSMLNGMGQPIDSSIEDLLSSLTVVRNADALSGKYDCGHGICVDSEKKLIGRVSATAVRVNPSLMR